MFSAIKTDLHLLLECLKYQMKCPDSQKQALLTIISICQQDAGQYVEFFKEIGGVTFIYNLFSSSHYSEVKETALFALGSLAEFNGIHFNSEILELKVSHNRKRVAVYMLSVLVSNNREPACLHVCVPIDESVAGTSIYNNDTLTALPDVPVNMEDTHCYWPQPICSFIGMAVANNMCAQEYFASLGGLVTLSDSLASLVPHCKDDIVACKLATIITRMLSACIADNKALAPVLSKLWLVEHFLLLLSVPNLSPQDQLVVVMTLDHCTSACGDFVDICVGIDFCGYC
uniref:Telomere repeat binding bouquet formation protein 1 n=1 Tax=Electrophorus electricus TaxID=8005 RepID=A0A4W4EQ45_ELEEL